MEKSRRVEFGVPWFYWLCVGAFLAMFVVSVFCAIRCEDIQDRRAGIAGGIVFFTIGFGGLLWPILCKKESKTVRREFIHSFNMRCEAVVFPMSRVKQFVTIAGAAGLLVGIGALLFFAHTDSIENQLKGIIALVFYIFVLVIGLKSLRAGKMGIFLVPNGVIWNEMFRAPCFIPWEIISQSSLFLKNEEHSGKVWAFGLNVIDPARFQTGKLTRKKIIDSKARHGWHFYFFQETIVFPLETVAWTVSFYSRYPELRREIGTASCLARIEGYEQLRINSQNPG